MQHHDQKSFHATHRVAGHFGEWLQGRLGPSGPVVLRTVTCPVLFTTCRRLSYGALDLRARPEALSDARAAQLLEHLACPPGTFAFTSTLPTGAGAGASTAALVALARAAGANERDIAAACLAVEGASDPLMMPRPDSVLWASRGNGQGRDFPRVPPVPRAEIIGGVFGPPIPTDPVDASFPDVTDLVTEMTQAEALTALAEIATHSAQRCIALRGPNSDPTAELARDLGALGWLRAHTGSARGLIFTPGDVPPHAAAALVEAGLSGILHFQTGAAL